jgi:hypothetical protein
VLSLVNGGLSIGGAVGTFQVIWHVMSAGSSGGRGSGCA